MTIYNWAAYAAATDLGATAGFTRQTGNSGSIAVNSSHNLDFVTTTPNSLYTCDEAASDSSFEITLIGGSGSGGNFYPCCVRVLDINNLIGARITSANNLELFKYVAGVATQLGSSVAITGRATGDKIKLTAVGNTLNVYYNGVLKIGPITESFNNTQTKMGMFMRSSTINNFVSAAESLNLGVAIASINSGNGVKVGSTGNTITTTGSTTMTALTIGGVSMTNVAGSGTSFTFDCPDQVDNTTSPKYGTQTASATTGVGTLTASTQYLPPNGYNYVTLVDPINTTVDGVVYNYIPAAVATDELAGETAKITLGTDGTAVAAYTGTQIIRHWSSVDSKIRFVSVITGSSGTQTSGTPSGQVLQGNTMVGQTLTGIRM